MKMLLILTALFMTTSTFAQTAQNLPLAGGTMKILKAEVLEQIRLPIETEGKLSPFVAVEGQLVTMDQSKELLAAGKIACFVLFDKYVPQNGDVLNISQARTQPIYANSTAFSAMARTTDGYFGFLCLSRTRAILGEQVRGAFNGILEFSK